MGLFDRLRGSNPQEATEALRQLIVSADPATLDPAELDRVLARFNVKGRSAYEVRVSIWRQAVTAALGDEVLTEEELRSLDTLRRLLQLGDDDTSRVRREAAQPLFERAVARTTAAGTLPAERRRLVETGKAMGLPPLSVEGTLDTFARQVIERAWQGATADGRVSREEAVRLRSLQRDLGVPLPPAYEQAVREMEALLAREKLAAEEHARRAREAEEVRAERERQAEAAAAERERQAAAAAAERARLEELWRQRDEKLLAMIEAAKAGVPLNPVPVTIQLQRGETCYATFGPAELHEMRKERFRGASFDKLTKIDRGTVYLTDRRLIFSGDLKLVSVRYDAVLEFRRYSDALLLRKETGKSPYILIDPPAALELAVLVLNRLLAERQASSREGQPSGDAPPKVHDVPAKPPVPPVETPPPDAATPQGSSSPASIGKDGPSADEVATLVEELNSLIGLAPVKREVASLVNLIRVRTMRKEMGLPITALSLHCVFTGAPGTGKTTVARLLARILRALSVLAKGQLVEVDRAELVGGYVGQTALKTDAVVKQALGGVLFVDEAYSLVQGERTQHDFGREAVDTLLKLMEDHREELVVIAAGYRDEMERFVESNPGLKSRFTRFIDFPDYSPEELFAIFASLAAESHYELSDEAVAAARDYFGRAHAERGANFGNGRFVRNAFEQAVSRQADRLAATAAPSRADLCTLEASDVVPTGAAAG